MIQADTTELEKSLLEYKLEVERKLKHMVAGFAKEVALAASLATRIGHVSEGGNTRKYLELYKGRKKTYGIAPIEGYHKGAWTYTEGALTFNPTIFDVGTMADKTEYQAEVSYKVGDSFTIGATGPAYKMLQGLDDIMGEAESTIRRTYQINLKRLYDEG